MSAAGVDSKAVGLHRRLLLGRDQEVEHLHGIIDRIAGRGGALVLRGEPGIGKSALLEAAEERASSQESRGGRLRTASGRRVTVRRVFAAATERFAARYGGA